MIRKICITGGIACGKSSVGAILRRKYGVPVIDVDTVCHRLLRQSKPLIGRVAAVFGKKALNPSGGVDRHALGRIIFADKNKRNRLNAMIHPAARREINAWLQSRRFCPDRARRRNTLVAAAVPLVYEAGWVRGWDKIICVAAPLAVQLARLKKKGLSEKAARARVAAQLPLAEKMDRSDFVVFNSGTRRALRRQTELLLEKNLMSGN